MSLLDSIISHFKFFVLVEIIAYYHQACHSRIYNLTKNSKELFPNVHLISIIYHYYHCFTLNHSITLSVILVPYTPSSHPLAHFISSRIMGDVAPALSTYQDETTFARYEEAVKPRDHLLLPPDSSYDDYVAEVTRFYQLDDLAQTITALTYTKITLQFPDDLICDSATVVHILQKLVPEREFWVLADTLYSPCCIDEVAAEHVHADVVVHFGNACLNTVASLPAIYVLGRPQVDVAAVAEALDNYANDEPDTPLVVMCDTQYAWKLCDIAEQAKADVVIADVGVDPQLKAEILGHQGSETGSTYRGLNRVIAGVTLAEELAAYRLFYLGSPEPPRMLQLATSFADVHFHDPQLSTATIPSLNRRYLNMHKARLAATVGLLLNTLSLANTRQLLDIIAAKVKAAGKKHYMFVVGKPNVAKLANYESIDVWCVVGCDHQGIILDEYNEYFKPIVTPYELLLALKDEMTWTGKWVTDYRSVLAEMADDETASDHQEIDLDYSDEEPEFDPVTGRFVQAKPLRQQAYLQVSASAENESDTESNTNDANQLVKKFLTTMTIKNTVLTLAAHLQTRAWTGLGSDWKDDEDYDEDGAVVEQGRGGVARGYDFDREVHQ